MTKPYEHLEDRDLKLRQTSNEEIIETMHPENPEAKDRITIVHDMAEEQRRRLLGDEAVSNTAQQQPGGAPIDTKRWRI